MMRTVHGNTVDRLGAAIIAGRYPPGTAILPDPHLRQDACCG
jgi:hypothetical protein